MIGLKNIKKAMFLTTCGILVAACATIVKTRNEEIMFTSAPNGATVQTSTGRNCITPCIVPTRSKVPFTAVVSYQGATAQIPVDVNIQAGGAWALAGNIIVAGGPLGLLVDVATGAAKEHKQKSYHTTFSRYKNEF